MNPARARPRRTLLGAAIAAALSAAALAVDSAVTPDWLNAPLGGTATLSVTNENAFARPIPTMAPEDLRRFTFGNRLFNTNWVAAPASVDAFDGLGPVFNRVSCSACHTRDGRGRPPEHDGEPLESMLMRISVPGTGAHGGVKSVPHYGDQLNEKALSGIPAEGRTVVHYRERRGEYPDGEKYSLLVPTYAFADLGFGPLPKDLLISPRVAPAVFGLGLLEAIPEAQILAHEDAKDVDGDGISGRANHVWDEVHQTTSLGRFGWKANQPGLRQQNAAAANGDIGLTSSMFPHENVAAGQVAAAAAPSGAAANAPELRDEFLDKLTFYVRTLAVPRSRIATTPDAAHGAALFESSGCVACHTPTFVTGDSPDVPELVQQTIHPFTDLLLHDMGKELSDGRPDYAATGAEWRTAPLWGIGLTSVVNRHTRFLHDGRARSIEEAVLWHGGEATRARDAFMHLSRDERRAVLDFLGSL